MRVKVHTEQLPQPVKSVEIADVTGEKFLEFIFCGSSGSQPRGVVVLTIGGEAYGYFASAARLSADELTELIRGLICLRNRLQEGDIK